MLTKWGLKLPSVPIQAGAARSLNCTSRAETAFIRILPPPPAPLLPSRPRAGCLDTDKRWDGENGAECQGSHGEGGLTL